jgi:hypothetical protein
MNNLYCSQNQYPLLEKPNNLKVKKKLVSISSCDRDTTIYPESNNFEIILPQSIKNVVRFRMVEGNFPNSNFNFSNLRQNTKFWFQITSGSNQGIYEATIEDGYYNPKQLANAITTAMNLAVSTSYTNFACSYNETNFKIYFGNKNQQFKLLFNKPSYYNIQCVDISANRFDKKTDWGFPYYLGFEKQEYSNLTSVSNASGYKFNYSTLYWLIPSVSGQPVYYMSPPLVSTFLGSDNIFMEIDKYNNIDETEHDQTDRNKTFGNSRFSKTNGCFARIPLFQTAPGKCFDSTNGLYFNSFDFDIPEERIDRLHFKFRDHNNYAVNFHNIPFSFTLEFLHL